MKWRSFINTELGVPGWLVCAFINTEVVKWKEDQFCALCGKWNVCGHDMSKMHLRKLQSGA